MAKKMNNISKSLCYSLIASIAYAITAVLVKHVSHTIPYNLIVFSRFAIGLIFLLPIVIKNPIIVTSVNNYKLHILRGLSGLLAIAGFFYSIKYIPLLDAMMLNNVAPIFIPIISALFLSDKISTRSMLSIICGFIGVVIVFHPDKEIFHFASFIALASSLFAAIASLSIRKLSQTNTTNTILFNYFLIAVIGVSMTLPSHYVVLDMQSLLILVIIGILGVIFQVCVTIAFTFSSASIVSPLLYSSIIFGAAIDWLLYGEIPTYLTIFGFLLIFAGCSLTIYFRKETTS